MGIKCIGNGYWKRSLWFSVILSGLVFLSFGLLNPVRAQATLSAPGDHHVQIVVGTTNRTFILHVPTGYDGSTAVPLVLMLHGLGGTAEGTSKLGWSEVADSNKFLVAYPQGSLQDPTKPAGPGNKPAWNEGSGRQGLPPVDDIAFLKAVISDIEANLKVDTQRVYLAGFSNGAAMTFYAAVNMSDQLAAIGMVSGEFWEKDDPSIKLAHPLPLVYIIGTADKLNPIAGGRARAPIEGPRVFIDKPPVQDYLTAWLKLNQCSASPTTIPNQSGVSETAYSCDPNFQLDYYTIQGMVHIWPVGPNASASAISEANSDSVSAGETAGAASSSGRNGSRQNYPINGAATMWQFFAQYILSGSATATAVPTAAVVPSATLAPTPSG